VYCEVKAAVEGGTKDVLPVVTEIAARMLADPESKLKMTAEAIRRTYYRYLEREKQSGVALLFLDKKRSTDAGKRACSENYATQKA
jgi:hypothetical protein